MRSGYINLNLTTGTLRETSFRNDNWSSRGSAITSAYNLLIADVGVGASDGPVQRYYGFPLRCLSTVLDI